jgi:hypothetical protein
VALKFLLHFVGDIHQPLHSSDDNDRGGNNKKVSAAGFRAGNLHHFWDTEFVDQLETNPQSIASDLIGHISRDQISTWQAAGPADWAQESFKVAKADAYGLLPEPSSRGRYRLTKGIHHDRHRRRGPAVEQGRRTTCVRAQQRSSKAMTCRHRRAPPGKWSRGSNQFGLA